jgi:hypothetical protein
MDADGWWPREEGKWENCRFYSSLRLGGLTFLIELGFPDNSGTRPWKWTLCGYSKWLWPDTLALLSYRGRGFPPGDGDGEWYLGKVKEHALRGGLWWLDERLKAVADARERAMGPRIWEVNERYTTFEMEYIRLIIRFPSPRRDFWWLAGRVRASPRLVPREHWWGAKPQSFTIFEKKMAASAELGEAKEAVIDETLAWLERHRTLILAMLPSEDGGQGHVSLG